MIPEELANNILKIINSGLPNVWTQEVGTGTVFCVLTFKPISPISMLNITPVMNCFNSVESVCWYNKDGDQPKVPSRIVITGMVNFKKVQAVFWVPFNESSDS